MDLDFTHGLDVEGYMTSSPSSPVATYPNTVPFRRPLRITHSVSPTANSIEIPTTSSRASSFVRADRPRSPLSRERTARHSFSSTLHLPGQPPIQYVSSRPHPQSFPMSTSTRPGSRSRPDSRMSTSSSQRLSKSKGQARMDEPRLLISNNDQTVKMFSLRPVDPTAHRSSTARQDQRVSDSRRPSAAALLQAADREFSRIERLRERVGRERGDLTSSRPSNPPARFGSGFGWDSVGVNEGISTIERETEALERQLTWTEDILRREQQSLRRERDEFERVIGMRVGLERTACPLPSERVEKENMREGMRLAKIGGSRFKYAINHCELVAFS